MEQIILPCIDKISNHELRVKLRIFQIRFLSVFDLLRFIVKDIISISIKTNVIDFHKYPAFVHYVIPETQGDRIRFHVFRWKDPRARTNGKLKLIPYNQFKWLMSLSDSLVVASHPYPRRNSGSTRGWVSCANPLSIGSGVSTNGIASLAKKGLVDPCYS